MRILFLLNFLLLINPWLWSQSLVSTQIEPKRIILEEFTGVRCNRCPDAHRIGYAIRDSQPDGVSIIALHPTDDWHTEPLTPGDPDLRNSYANRFYHQGNFGGPLYMPAGMVNRREWLPGKRAIGRELWQAAADSIRQETAPLNLGLQARYNPNSRELLVEVEVFHTQASVGGQKLCVVLTEDSLRVPQAGQGPNYRQNHVFRHSFTDDPYGEWIAVSPDSGDFQRKTYRFINVADTFHMQHCRVVAYVRAPDTEEILNGGEAEITLDPTAHLATRGHADLLKLQVTGEMLWLEWEMARPGQVEATLVGMDGKALRSWKVGGLLPGLQKQKFPLSGVAAGIYVWKMRAAGLQYVQKIRVP
jgi:hypothetical protein